MTDTQKTDAQLHPHPLHPEYQEGFRDGFASRDEQVARLTKQRDLLGSFIGDCVYNNISFDKGDALETLRLVKALSEPSADGKGNE
jgi:hypothetical protein